MDKLANEYVILTDAVSYLMELYRKHTTFMKEFSELRQKHIQSINEFASLAMETRIPVFTYQEISLYFINGIETDFIKENKTYVDKMQAYIHELSEFATKWRLKSYWSGGALLFLDALDFAQPGMKGYVSFRNLVGLWISPLPPLQIRVDSWKLISLGRKTILSQIASDLKQYEDNIRKKGKMKRYPSGLKRHAFWWFEHYVLGKPYKQISQENKRAYEETIKRKVYEFSKLLELKMT